MCYFVYGVVHIKEPLLLIGKISPCGSSKLFVSYHMSERDVAFAHGAMGRQIDPSWWVDPLRYFSFQPVLHDWCNKGHGMCYPVYFTDRIAHTTAFVTPAGKRNSSMSPSSPMGWSNLQEGNRLILFSSKLSFNESVLREMNNVCFDKLTHLEVMSSWYGQQLFVVMIYTNMIIK